MRRKLTFAGLILIFAFLVAVWLAGSLLSAPVNQSVGALPADLTGREVQFSSSSGAMIHGWLIEGKEGAGVIVLMHGVRGNRSSMLERARFLSRAGYAVLLFDFQSHGESVGKHITFGYLESRDAQAAIDFLRREFPKEKIGVIGDSMGGAATLLASPPLEVNAIVLEMVYPTMNQAIENRLTMRLGDWAKFLTPLLAWQLKPRLGISAEDLRPINNIGKVDAPKLLIVGEQDKHTTLEESMQLFKAAKEPKEIWIVKNAAHVDLHDVAREEYEAHVMSFFAKNLR